MPEYCVIPTAALSATADAIKAKTGSAEDIEFTQDGFADAIEAIPTGDTSMEDGIIMHTVSGFYENSRVTSIGMYAFARCYNLTAIDFSACTSIGSYAFSTCSQLMSVSFPVCEIIGTYAFTGCSKLTTASFPSCISIGTSAFATCSMLNTINFPVCRSIGSYAFQRCSALTTANFPECVSLSTGVFNWCSELSVISFPVCSTIMASAIQSCRKLLSAYFLGPSVPKVSHSNFLSSTPIAGYTASTGGVLGSIFVRASMLEAFQSATNWSPYADRMVGLTDAEIEALS